MIITISSYMHSAGLLVARWFAGIALFLTLVITWSAIPVYAENSLIEKLNDYPTSIVGENIPVDQLLQAIGRQSGINIFVGDDIKGAITINMDNLTLYDVFQLIMKSRQLDYNEKNNIVYVQKETESSRTKKDMTTIRLCTKFGNADDHLEQLNPLLSKIGSITVTNRGNCLVIRDHQFNIELIEQILSELDLPIPQVHIEARIVFLNDKAKDSLGIKWGYQNYRDSTELSATSKPVTSASDLSILNTRSSMAFGFIRDNINLNFELQAMQEDNQIRILSAPQILVLDGKEAEIKQGKEVPYVTQSGDLINTSFREANLSLKVTPQILHDNYIMLDIRVTNDTVDQLNISGGEPLINKQEINTNLFLENGATVVIGGILLESKEDQHSGVPGLSNIPLLGNLFKNSEKIDDCSELLVFLTPSIVNMQTAMLDSRASDNPSLRVRDIDKLPTTKSASAKQKNPSVIIPIKAKVVK
ncbi:MAG: type IV pilus secretin PilQ [Thermodesulfobacteriota bacterium]|nr:type IV pilus secretin PilQ [Thermodesulfobacteriota bacterium]